MTAHTEVDRAWHTVLSTDVRAAPSLLSLGMESWPGELRVSACVMVCVCVCVWWCVCVWERERKWVCSQHCCGDSDSERQTGKQREASGKVPPPPLPSYAALKSLWLCQFSACVCVCLCPSVWEKDALCMVVQLCEVTMLLVRPYFKACDSWSAPASTDPLG